MVARFMMKYLRCACALGFLALGILSAVAEDVSELRLVPFPKEVRLGPGRFDLVQGLVLEVAAARAESFGRSLNEELRRAGLPPAQVRPWLATRTGSG